MSVLLVLHVGQAQATVERDSAQTAAQPAATAPAATTPDPDVTQASVFADAGAPLDAEVAGSVTVGPALDGGSSGDVDELAALRERVKALEEQMAESKKATESLKKDDDILNAKVRELAQAIQFSGFFDVSLSTYGSNPNLFEVGSFEFDIKKEFYKHFQVGAALVFADKESDLAVGFIDFHLFGGLIPARGNVFLESGFHVQVGKFDVNFGNDWQYFASLDRPTMSAPLTTTVLMDGGYNDTGFRVLGNHSFINYAGYVLRGAGVGTAVGGRIAVVPFNNPFTMESADNQPLDVGVGFIEDVSQSGKTDQRTFAGDVEARVAFLRLQAEYYQRHDLLQSLRRTGFQVSLFGTFLEDGPLPFGASARFDTLGSTADDGALDETLRRLTVGCFLRPFDVTVMKVEFAHFFDGNADLHGNSAFAQLVIGFK